MASISLEELPHRQFLKPLIYCGINAEKIAEICKKWNLLQISFIDFQEIEKELISDKNIAKLIQSNRELIKAGKTPRMKDVRAEYKFPEVFDKLVKSLAKFALTGDLDDLELPEELTYILFNYRLRPFIECGKAVGFSFYQLNRIWKRFNPVGIIHEYYDIYLEYFWNIELINSSEILSYIEVAIKDHYYDIHTKIIGQDKACFLGYFGFLDEIQYQQMLRKMMLHILDQEEKNSIIGKKELNNLYKFCNKEHDKKVDLEHDPMKLPKQLFHNELTSADVIDEKSAKMIIWRKNQEYLFKKYVDFKQKLTGETP